MAGLLNRKKDVRDGMYGRLRNRIRWSSVCARVLYSMRALVFRPFCMCSFV